MTVAVAAPAPSEPDDHIDAEFYGTLLDLAVRSYVANSNDALIRSDIRAALTGQLGFDAFGALVEQEIQRITP